MSMGIVNKDTAATIPAAGNTGDKVGNLAALHTTSKSDIVSAINEVKDEQANKADNDIVADAFSEEETYAEGDYCTYEGGLYKFKTSHSGAWSAADVDQIQIAGELSELKNTLTYDKVISSQSTTLATNQTFTPTSDGLLTVQVLSGKRIKIYTKDGGGNLVAIIEIDNTSNNSNLYSFFIKKGMPLIKSSDDANGYITFRYLVS